VTTPPETPPPVERRMTVPRTARYYLLGGETARDIWVVLHGFGQLAARFIRSFAPAAGPGRLIVAPEALNYYYTNHEAKKSGATWMTSENRLVQIEDYVRYLDLLLEEVAGGQDRPVVEVHGFSQGAATASRWVSFGQVRPRRLVLWGGGVPPDLDLARYGDRLSQARLTRVIGDRDQYVSEETVTGESERLNAAGVKYELKRFRGGHLVPWSVLQTLVEG
jgi:predicted esterase